LLVFAFSSVFEYLRHTPVSVSSLLKAFARRKVNTRFLTRLRAGRKILRVLLASTGTSVRDGGGCGEPAVLRGSAYTWGWVGGGHVRWWKLLLFEGL